MHHGSRADDSASSHPIAHLIDQLAHLLPAQGPISIFIHHNTLHALRAPAVSKRRSRPPPTGWDANRSWPSRAIATSWRRAAFSRTDVRGPDPGTAGRPRRHMTSPASARASTSGGQLCCTAFPRQPAENSRGFLKKRRRFPDFALMSPLRPAPPDRTSASSTIAPAKNGERCVACGMRASSGVSRAGPRQFRPSRRFRFGIATGCRPSTAIDTDAWIHPPLIRFLAGYLDQGLAHWSMPERRLGIHGCFLEIYRHAVGSPMRRVGTTCYRASWARMALPAAARSNRSPTRSPSSV